MKNYFILFVFGFMVFPLFSQNIGIGTALPTAKLAIQSNGNTLLSNALSVADNGGNIILLVRDDQKVGIRTGNPLAGLHLISDEGFLATGNNGAGTATTLGAGARMYWYPKKSAFRAGEVNGTNWDDSNIGNYSVALGLETKASGNASTATGNSSVATGAASTAMGFNANAGGFGSVAVGFLPTASGDYSVAMGYIAGATALNALALGYNAQASGQFSTAIGLNTSATNSYAAAIGNGTSASGSGAVAIGYASIASGEGAMGMGYYSTASGDYSSATNRQTVASGTNSFASGYFSTASGWSSTAMGIQSAATGYGSFCAGALSTTGGSFSSNLGVSNNPTGDDAVTIGTGLTAPSYSEIALGLYNTTYIPASPNNFPAATDRLLVVGNGFSSGILSDALVILKNGNTTINGNLSVNGVLCSSSGTIAACSDIRYKQNVSLIAPATALATLGTINAYHYDFKISEFPEKNFPATPQIGFIAQELEKSYPELVFTDEKGYKSVDYAKMTPILLAAIQALAAQNAHLQSQIDALNVAVLQESK